MSGFLKSVKWGNIALFVLDMLNKWGEFFPGAELPAWVSIIQTILGFFTTSAFGWAHKVEFGENQAPESR